MKDLPALFKAFVMPYTAVCCISGIVFMTGTGQEVPIYIWGLLGFAFTEMGFEYGVKKIRKK